MKTLTKDQLEIQNFLREQHEELQRLLEAGEILGYGHATYEDSDILELEEYNVHTLEDYQRHSLANDLWDYYKTVHGVRPRWLNLYEMSYTELQELSDQLDREYEIQEKYRREYEEEQEKSKAKHRELLRKASEENEFLTQNLGDLLAI